MRVPRAIVVSLRKSGTHLIKVAISAVGYSVTGQIAESAAGPRQDHYLDQDTVHRIMRMVYLTDEIAEITSSTDQAVIAQAIQRGRDALMNSWRIRLGLPESTRLPDDDLVTQLTARMLTRGAARRFADTPPDLCWFLHQLDIAEVDHTFIREWMDSGEPRIILNYRDPRDTLLSMVNFLATRSAADLAGLPEHQLYGEIVKAIPTTELRLTFALRDPCFPGADSFARALWLRHHPRVCAVSFEDLVGPAGGGTVRAQTATIAKLIDFLGADQSPAKVGRRLFNPDSFTFHRGQIGAWREHFTPRTAARARIPRPWISGTRPDALQREGRWCRDYAANCGGLDTRKRPGISFIAWTPGRIH